MGMALYWALGIQGVKNIVLALKKGIINDIYTEFNHIVSTVQQAGKFSVPYI